MQWNGVSKENLPGHNNIFVEVADDIVVIGYPRSFYDKTNLYPIVKAGIIDPTKVARFALQVGASVEGRKPNAIKGGSVVALLVIGLHYAPGGPGQASV